MPSPRRAFRSPWIWSVSPLARHHRKRGLLAYSLRMRFHSRSMLLGAVLFAPVIALAQEGSFVSAGVQLHYDVRPGLRKLDRPVLIVQGHQDPIGDKTAEDIHALIPRSTLTYINKAGHFPWIEQPEDFRRSIAMFLAQSTSGSQR